MGTTVRTRVFSSTAPPIQESVNSTVPLNPSPPHAANSQNTSSISLVYERQMKHVRKWSTFSKPEPPRISGGMSLRGMDGPRTARPPNRTCQSTSSCSTMDGECGRIGRIGDRGFTRPQRGENPQPKRRFPHLFQPTSPASQLAGTPPDGAEPWTGTNPPLSAVRSRLTSRRRPRFRGRTTPTRWP